MTTAVDVAVGRFVEANAARVLVTCDSYSGPSPSRHVEVGIREMTAVSVAAGLAASGLQPVVLALNVFLLTRAFGQLRQDVVVNALPVTVIGKAAGRTLAVQGPSHYLESDLLLLKSLAPLAIACPSTTEDLVGVLDESVGVQPVYVRVAGLDGVKEKQLPERVGLEPVMVLTTGERLSRDALRTALGDDVDLRFHRLRYVDPLDEVVRDFSGMIVVDETDATHLGMIIRSSLSAATSVLTWNDGLRALRHLA
jgi:deoxyxylulose-5-phosphate synthase